MLKIKFTQVVWILYYAFIFFYLLNHSFQSLDTDFGWHLKVGEEIARSGEVPHIEHFNFTLQGQRWVDHEWLANVFIYFIHSNFGYASLSMFFVLIIVLTLFVLNKFTQKYFLQHNQKGIFLIIAFQILGVIAMQPHFGVRVQEITVFNLLILLIVMHYFVKTLQCNVSTVLWLLPPLFYFWACVHAGFLIGLFVMFLWICFRFFEILVQEKISFKLEASTNQWLNFQKIYSNPGFKKLMFFSIFAFFSFLATLVTPYGLELYSFLGGYSDTYYLTHISEWLPFSYLPILYWQLLYAAFVVAAILLPFLLGKQDLSKKEANIKLYWYIFLTLVFLFLALKSRRHFPLFFVISFPLLVQFFYNFCELSEKTLANIKKSLFIKFYVIVCFLLVITNQFIDTNFVQDPFQHFKAGYPAESVQFIKDNPKYFGKRTLVEYAWGGYLVWALPENQLFIDGRLPQYAFQGHTMLREYDEFFQKGQTRRKLNEHDIELILLPIGKEKIKLNWFEKYFLKFNEEELNNRKNYLKEYLSSVDDWEVVYEDGVSRVYIKN